MKPSHRPNTARRGHTIGGLSPLGFGLQGLGVKTGLGLGLALLAAAPAQAFTLSEAVESALRSEPGFLGAEQAMIAAREVRPQAIGAILPSINAEASYRRLNSESSNTTQTPLGPQVFGNKSTGLNARAYSISLSQPLFSLPAFVALAQSSKQLAAAEIDFARARQDVLLRVSSAYFDVLNAQTALASTQAEKAAIGEQLAAAKRSFEVGSATITDQQEAQARFDLASAREIAALNSLAIRRSTLAQLTRLPVPDRLPEPVGRLTVDLPQPTDPADWSARARESSLEVIRAGLQSEVASLEVNRRWGGHLPTVALIANASRADNASSVGSENNSDFVGVQVQLPIFLGGRVSSSVREAVALQNQAGFGLDNARLQSEQSARTAYLNLMAGISQVSALEAAERSSQLALKSNQLGYEVGVRINVDVLNAQQQLFAAQRDLAQARFNTLLASLQLQAAVGQLDQADIDQVSGLIAAKLPPKPAAATPAKP